MVRQHYNADWAFAITHWIREAVERHYRSDLHRWPVIQAFDAEVYQARPDARLFILKDKSATGATPTISSSTDAKEWPRHIPEIQSDPFGPAALLGVADRLHKAFALRQQDVALLMPELKGHSTDEEWDMLTPDMKYAINLQIAHTVERQLHYIRGFDRVGEFLLPPGYEFLSRECERFFNDHPRYDRNVFLMTRFDAGSGFLVTLDQELRRVLRHYDFDPVRADDKMYMPDRNLWNNVCVYMLCSQRGVAVLEDRAADEFNPNVAIEYGFMRGLNKPTLLLADKGFRNLRADVIGTLRETFDLLNIEGTVQPAIERWISDLKGNFQQR
ncbi:hypothetical protein [Micromonospora sp. CA-246542]|uniref:hypothetical protein n=1 Tax=Micromonospora sp. CA-246542 TaxID=3239959 RepID=UPI003D8AAA02